MEKRYLVTFRVDITARNSDEATDFAWMMVANEVDGYETDVEEIKPWDGLNHSQE